MLAALDCGFENTWQASASSGTGGTTPSILASSVANLSESNFGPSAGVTTTATISGVAAPLPVLVMADYSLWCPVLGTYVRPEDTNLKTKLSE